MSVGLSLALESELDMMSIITRTNCLGSKRIYFSPPNCSSPIHPAKKSLYMFYEHYEISSGIAYSLYRLDVHIDPKKSTTQAPRQILGFKRDKFPQGMQCAKLGSKLYFLGGTYGDGESSRKVFEYNTSTEEFNEMDECLNAGKPRYSIVFAANGKLYALAPIPNPYFTKLSEEQLLFLSLFECFDHTTNKWHVLGNLPQTKGIRIECINWEGCTVLGRRQQVVVIGSKSPGSPYVKFVYHLQRNEWTRDILYHGNIGDSSVELSFHEGGNDKSYLYGILGMGPPIKSKTGYVTKSSSDGTTLPNAAGVFTRMSIHGMPTVEGEKWAEWVRTYFPHWSKPEGTEWVYNYGRSNRLVRYLGSDLFCYVVHTEGSITITLFKESEKNKGKCERPFSRIEVLHSQQYLIKTSQDSTVQYLNGELLGCFVVTLGEQLQEKTNKKKKKKKYKKKKKNNTMQPLEEIESLFVFD